MADNDIISNDDNDIEEKNAANDVSYIPLIATGVVVVILWALCWVLVTNYFAREDRGIFGDMFGSVNALFSGLAFAGIIYTILLQRTELRLQRLELTATRSELRRSAQAQEESRAALGQQVSNQLRASRIHGLSTLVEHYTIRLKGMNDMPPTLIKEDYRKHQERRDQFLADLLKEISESRM